MCTDELAVNPWVYQLNTFHYSYQVGIACTLWWHIFHVLTYLRQETDTNFFVMIASYELNTMPDATYTWWGYLRKFWQFTLHPVLHYALLKKCQKWCGIFSSKQNEFVYVGNISNFQTDTFGWQENMVETGSKFLIHYSDWTSTEFSLEEANPILHQFFLLHCYKRLLKSYKFL